MKYINNKILDDFNAANIKDLKAELLCLGIRVSNSSVDEYFIENNFINGSQLMLLNNTIINVAVNEEFVYRYSPFELIKKDNNWIILKNGKPIIDCKPILMPNWVNLHIDNYMKIGDIVRPHSESILFVTPVKECVFGRMRKKCKFCTFSGHSVYDMDILQKSFITIFVKTNDKYKEVAIGGATPNLKDYGASYYCKITKIIKMINPEIKISLEIIPPKDLNMLQDIYDSGVDSIIMNLEIFDDSVRKEICPGKFLIPKSHYFAAYEKALEIFSENKVSSVLIVGLENRDSTIYGAKKMLEMGVIPTLIPFRPYNNCELRHLIPVKPNDYLSIYDEVFTKKQFSKRVNPLDQPGCTHCGGCSLETIFTEKLNGYTK